MSHDKSVLERFQNGSRDMLVEPLDYLLLGELPSEGTNIGGLYQVGATVDSLNKKFPAGSNILSSRLRLLRQLGLTVVVKVVGGRGGRSWQATPKGKEILNEWKQSQ